MFSIILFKNLTVTSGDFIKISVFFSLCINLKVLYYSIAVLRQYSLDQMKKTDKSFVGETFLKPGEVYEVFYNLSI